MIKRALAGLISLALAIAPVQAQFLPGRAPGLYNTGLINKGSGAVADYDFKNNILVGPALSVSRASVAYQDDSQGNWTAFPANTLRQTDKGALIEGAQTNSIRNNSMQGAVAGAPGTLPTNWAFDAGAVSRQIVGTGTQNGIDYIDVRFFASSSDGSYNYYFDSGIAAAQSQLWTGSVFLAVVAGTVPSVTQAVVIREDNSGGTSLVVDQGTSFAGQLTSTMKRFSISQTLGQATVASIRPGIRFQYGTGTAFDFTLRIGWPQLEQWSTSVTTVGGASSPIRTTGTAATRAADVVTATSSLPAYTATVAAVINETVGGSFSQYVALSDGTNSNRITLQRSGAAESYSVSTVAGTNTGSNRVSRTDGRHAQALAFAANDAAITVDGGVPVTTATFPIPSGGPTKLSIGSSPTGGSLMYGYIERLAVFPYRQPNGLLQYNSQLSAWGG